MVKLFCKIFLLVNFVANYCAVAHSRCAGAQYAPVALGETFHL
jgi:hypothetical protein